MDLKQATHAYVFLDTETIPSKDAPAEFEFSERCPELPDVPDHGSLSDPVKIKDWKEKKLATMISEWEDRKKKAEDKQWAYLREEGLTSYNGRIYCLSWAINDDPEKCVNFLGGEKEMLQAFYNDIKDYKTLSFVGCNIPFDLLFIFHRSLALGVPELAEKVRADHGYTKGRDWDVMEMAGGGLMWKYKISLDNLCQLLGIPTSKDDIRGSEVFDCYLRGEYERIDTYCKKDVNRTRLVFKKLK